MYRWAEIYVMKYIPDLTFDPTPRYFASRGALQRKSKYTNKRSRAEVIKQIRAVAMPTGKQEPTCSCRTCASTRVAAVVLPQSCKFYNPKYLLTRSAQ